MTELMPGVEHSPLALLMLGKQSDPDSERGVDCPGALPSASDPDLVARAETAKIAVSAGGRSTIALDHIEAGLASELDAVDAKRALDADLDRIVAAARTTVAQAGAGAAAIDTLYLTGGSTGLDILSERLHAAFAGARVVRGDRFASVATGLALFAARRFATSARR